MATDEFEMVNTSFRLAVTIKDHAKVADMPAVMARDFRDLMSYVQRRGIKVSGPPFTYYHAWSDKEVDLECGFPTGEEVKNDGRFKAFILPSVRAVVAMHSGPYSDIVRTYTEVQRWMKENAHQPTDQMWEIYLNDPTTTAQSDLLTQIVWPLK